MVGSLFVCNVGKIVSTLVTILLTILLLTPELLRTGNNDAFPIDFNKVFRFPYIFTK
ncbi:unnamed protein product [Schistosoma curassoni]|uniref:Aa_trans domain-containing protein n=1 Tax=Schistosoma curassoni TaxID=6186 RepID=A0A183JBP5_9TREM|nr:unnamed protein product [Schistosoma curassoni]